MGRNLSAFFNFIFPPFLDRAEPEYGRIGRAPGSHGHAQLPHGAHPDARPAALLIPGDNRGRQTSPLPLPGLRIRGTYTQWSKLLRPKPRTPYTFSQLGLLPILVQNNHKRLGIIASINEALYCIYHLYVFTFLSSITAAPPPPPNSGKLF